MVDERARQQFAIGWQVDQLARRVGGDVGAAEPAEADGVDRVFEQRVEGGRDEEVEVRDLREFRQRPGAARRSLRA